MNEKVVPIGTSINQWADAISLAEPRLSALLNEDRQVGYDNIDTFGLPKYRRVQTPVESFLAATEENFSQINSDLYIINLLPKADGIPRIRKSGLSRDKVVTCIAEQIPEENRSKYELVLIEYFKAKFGGNIIIDKNGSILLEAVQGDQNAVAAGTTPEYVVRRDPYLKTFKYSFEDPSLRQVLLNTILAIPHTGDGRDMEFPFGYFEFNIIQRDIEAPLEPLFFDFRQNPAFLLNK